MLFLDQVLVVSPLKGDKVVYEGYFGYADIEKGMNVDANTAFYIASSTKPFFALNALLLAREDRLDTEASLQSLFPGMAFQGFDAGAVTVRDLLVHTSGLDNDPIVWATATSGMSCASNWGGDAGENTGPCNSSGAGLARHSVGVPGHVIE